MNNTIIYEEDIAIDPHKLDEEWLKQPVLCRQYNGLLAGAEAVCKKMKGKLDLLNAELFIQHKSDMSSGKVPTDTMVKSLITIDEEYQKTKETLMEETAKVEYLKVAVKSMDDKKKALQELVALYTADYFAVPTELKQVEGGKWSLKKSKKMETRSRKRLTDKFKNKNKKKEEE